MDKKKIDKIIKCEVCGKELRNRKARAGHMWFAHQMRVGQLWDLENEIRKLKEMSILFISCHKCGKPVRVDMSVEKVRRGIIEALNDKSRRIVHSKCSAVEENKRALCSGSSQPVTQTKG